MRFQIERCPIFIALFFIIFFGAFDWLSHNGACAPKQLPDFRMGIATSCACTIKGGGVMLSPQTCDGFHNAMPWPPAITIMTHAGPCFHSPYPAPASNAVNTNDAVFDTPLRKVRETAG